MVKMIVKMDLMKETALALRRSHVNRMNLRAKHHTNAFHRRGFVTMNR